MRNRPQQQRDQKGSLLSQSLFLSLFKGMMIMAVVKRRQPPSALYYRLLVNFSSAALPVNREHVTARESWTSNNPKSDNKSSLLPCAPLSFLLCLCWSDAHYTIPIMKSKKTDVAIASSSFFLLFSPSYPTLSLKERAWRSFSSSSLSSPPLHYFQRLSF